MRQLFLFAEIEVIWSPHSECIKLHNLLSFWLLFFHFHNLVAVIYFSFSPRTFFPKTEAKYSIKFLVDGLCCHTSHRCLLKASTFEWRIEWRMWGKRGEKWICLWSGAETGPRLIARERRKGYLLCSLYVSPAPSGNPAITPKCCRSVWAHHYRGSSHGSPPEHRHKPCCAALASSALTVSDAAISKHIWLEHKVGLWPHQRDQHASATN